MKTALVIGANRGIGLEYIKQLLAAGYQVSATCRQPERAKELASLAKSDSLMIKALEVTDLKQIKELKQQLKNQPIDLLVINAGIYGDQEVTIGKVDRANLEKVLAVNSIAPLIIADQLIDLVSKSEQKMIIALTSQMGSIGDNSSGGSYAYRGSKAALNAMLYSFALDAKSQSVKLLLVHPGWVKTDMGGPNALINVQESVTGMLKVIKQADKYSTGSFVNYRGEILPW